MTLVLIASQPNGTIQNSAGDAKPGPATFLDSNRNPATHYADAAGTGASTAAITADSRGRIMRWIAAGVYTQVIGGEELEFHATPGSVETRVGQDVPTRSLWYFLAPIVAPTPAQTLTAIHAGFDWTVDTGGVLLIPDPGADPWEVNGTIVKPPNARWMGPFSARLMERQSRSGHGTAFYQMPATGKALGGAWIKLSDNSNCPIFATDYTNALGKRGPARGNGGYWQWSGTFGIVFDHNGRNQAASSANGTGDLANASPTVSNPTGSWSPGDIFVHANVPSGTYVKTVGATLTLTENATGTAAGASLSKGTIAIDIRNAWGVNFAYCTLLAARGRGWSFYSCNECSTEKISAVGDVEEIANGTGDSTNGLSTILNASGTWAVGDLITALPGFAYGTYVHSIAGSTLTLYSAGSPAVATSTVAGMSLTKPTMIADHQLCLVNNTTDSEHIGYSMHGARLSTGLIDSARGNVLDGLLGYTIGGHNLWLRNRFGGDCINNTVTGRLDQATKHNCRIDTGCKSNQILTSDFSPGLFGTAADGDGGWVNKYDDGTHNKIGGVGSKGWGAEANISNIGAFGPNSGFGEGSMAGGHDLPASTRLWRLPSSAPSTNRVLGQVVFGKSCEEFAPRAGAALVTVNTDEIVRSFADATTDAAVANFIVPDGIRGLILRPILMNLVTGGATGDVRLNLGLAQIALGGGAILGADATVLAATVTIPATFAHVVTSFAGVVYSVSPGNLVSLRFKRLGADAADTLAASVGFVGIRVEPLLLSS